MLKILNLTLKHSSSLFILSSVTPLNPMELLKTRALRECRPPPRELNLDPKIFGLDLDSDTDHSQNLITCFLSYLGHILKISPKFVSKFLSYFVHKQTHKLT